MPVPSPVDFATEGLDFTAEADDGMGLDLFRDRAKNGRMMTLLPLDDLSTHISTTVRAAVTAAAKRLVSRLLRAIAAAITILADSLAGPKKEKGLNVVRCRMNSRIPLALNPFERISPLDLAPVA